MAELTPDELKQIRLFIAMARDILERYARTYEELEGIRLSLEEQRELQAEHFEENARWADSLSKRMDRQERYVILKGMATTDHLVGGGRETIQIETIVAREHIDRALREELVTQQELILQYQKNIDKVKLKIAKFGDTVALVNEVDDYQKQIDKSQEAISRIRQNLD